VATELLHGCPVVTGAGDTIGHVRSILIDAKTRQIRYVILSSSSSATSVAVPWHAMYFDSALVRLVFYTYS
jgi:sporulation protein YlmC with PRC-barrel domain